MAFVLDEIYKLLHPFMPFMTEELWAQTAGEGQTRATLLCHAAWPAPDFEDADAAAEINWLIDLVSGIRSVRSEMNVPPAAIAPLVVVGANAETQERLARHDAAIKRLARVGEISHADAAPAASAQFVVGEATACLPLGTLIDLAAEKARLEKEIAKVDRRDRPPAQEAVEREVRRQRAGRGGRRRAREARRVSRGAGEARHGAFQGPQRELSAARSMPLRNVSGQADMPQREARDRDHFSPRCCHNVTGA